MTADVIKGPFRQAALASMNTVEGPDERAILRTALTEEITARLHSEMEVLSASLKYLGLDSSVWGEEPSGNKIHLQINDPTRKKPWTRHLFTFDIQIAEISVQAASYGYQKREKDILPVRTDIKMDVNRFGAHEMDKLQAEIIKTLLKERKFSARDIEKILCASDEEREIIRKRQSEKVRVSVFFCAPE